MEWMTFDLFSLFEQNFLACTVTLFYIVQHLIGQNLIKRVRVSKRYICNMFLIIVKKFDDVQVFTECSP